MATSHSPLCAGWLTHSWHHFCLILLQPLWLHHLYSLGHLLALLLNGSHTCAELLAGIRPVEHSRYLSDPLKWHRVELHHRRDWPTWIDIDFLFGLLDSGCVLAAARCCLLATILLKDLFQELLISCTLRTFRNDLIHKPVPRPARTKN